MDDRFGKIFLGIAIFVSLIALYVTYTAPMPEGFTIKEVVKDVMLITQIMISILGTGALIKYIMS